jgi:hypothetical protein
LTAVNADKTTDTVTLTSDADGQVFWPRTRTVQSSAIEDTAVVRARTTSTTNVAVSSVSIGEGRSTDGKTTTLTWFKAAAEALALTIPDPVSDLKLQHTAAFLPLSNVLHDTSRPPFSTQADQPSNSAHTPATPAIQQPVFTSSEGEY